MANPHPLDNPIWHALHTEHSTLAIGTGLARRYPAAVGPLSGMADQSQASYEALRTLAGPGGTLVLFLVDPPALPSGWTMVRDGTLSQMVCTNFNAPTDDPRPAITRLSSADVPAMLELTHLTEPGPFRERTIELGAFFGIFDATRLLAMAGQRLHLPQYVEVSAVCTHPQARGRGYAYALMAEAIREIQERGKIAFLHVFADNHAAIRVYERLGFTRRRDLHLAVIRNDL
jgi:GNAT superfamily N-acetyltransferase